MAQIIATILVGILASCGLLGGLFLPRRTDLRAKYRERMDAAQARIRARQIEPALRALYEELSHEVTAMSLAPGANIPSEAFEAAVAGTTIRLRVSQVSTALTAESHLTAQLTSLIEAQVRVLTWMLILGGWTLFGLLGLLLLTFSSWQWELVAASVYATMLVLMFVRLGRLLQLAIGRESELDHRLAEIETGP